MRILFVCLGNICRSPLAEALFIHKTKTQGIAHLFEVDSCGTSNYNIGDGPDPRTRANAERNGVRMSHVARQLARDDFEYYDRILAMDSQNHRNLLASSDPAHHAKIMMMRAFDPGGAGDVPDPYWGDEDEFQEVFEILDRTLDAFIKHLREEKAG